MGRVETGFQKYISMVYTDGKLPDVQLKQLRYAYFAGVHWMQVILPNTLDMGDEPTLTDLEVMDDIHSEIGALAGHVAPFKGHA